MNILRSSYVSSFICPAGNSLCTDDRPHNAMAEYICHLRDPVNRGAVINDGAEEKRVSRWGLGVPLQNSVGKKMFLAKAYCLIFHLLCGVCFSKT